MKNILCYGDSNTYGLDPSTDGRYEYDRRWTGILQKLLGDQYYVIEEGLNGRTTALDEPGLEYRNGYNFVQSCICSHVPLDYMIVMLGTNDTKTIFHKEAGQIAIYMRRLLELIQKVLGEVNSRDCKILLVVPAAIDDCVADGPLNCEFDLDSARRSRELGAYYVQEAKRMEIDVLDLSGQISACKMDGIHLLPEEHEKIAAQIANWIRS